ncbi:Hypothetical predicted protein, partial [Pelobates cultripes]
GQPGPTTETPTLPEGVQSSPQMSTAQAAHQRPGRGERERGKQDDQWEATRPPTTSLNPHTHLRDSTANVSHKQAVTHKSLPQAAPPGRRGTDPSCTTAGPARTSLTHGHHLNRFTWTIQTAPSTPCMDISAYN